MSTSVSGISNALSSAVSSVDQARLKALQPQSDNGIKKNQPFELAFESGGDSRPGLKLSAHAKERMNLRDIHLSQEDMARLSDAVDQVATKGGKQSILVMDQLAFIVSVTNRTVITVLDGGSMKAHTFVNIDSAMIF
jgi:flagellar operon protein